MPGCPRGGGGGEGLQDRGNPPHEGFAVLGFACFAGIGNPGQGSVLTFPYQPTFPSSLPLSFPPIPVFYPSVFSLLSSGIGYIRFRRYIGGTDSAPASLFPNHSRTHPRHVLHCWRCHVRVFLSLGQGQLAFHAFFPDALATGIESRLAYFLDKSHNVLQTYPGYGTSRFRFPS